MRTSNEDDTRWHHDSDGEYELRPAPSLLLALYITAAIVAVITAGAALWTESRLLDWFFP